METLFKNIQNNWKSGITVSLVSIPLSVSLAVASQTSPVIGILTAVWAGLIASIFGGSNYNIIGPTGALSGILAAYALMYGPATLAPLAIVAGIFILIAYIAKLERFLVFVPGSTVQGFTLGVAVIISLGQLNFALGLSHLPKHESSWQMSSNH
jgi:SulP family sulfate permease